MTTFSGHLSLRAELRPDGRTALGHQAFRAPFHLSKPYWDGTTLIVQVVNPTAGILSGDSLHSNVSVAPNAALLITTPSATRVFQMDTGSAQSTQTFSVETGGWLDVLPEPLVLHKGSTFKQVTRLDAAADADFFYADLLLSGRIARGETWAWSKLCLDLTVCIEDELIVRERFQQSGAELKTLALLAGAADGAGFANIVVASPRLADETAWRLQVGALHSAGIWVGASRLRGPTPAYSIKVVARDGDALRRTLQDIRHILSLPLPKLLSDPRKL